MELFQVDDKGHLFISPDIDDWQPINDYGINVVFDLDGGLDTSTSSMPNDILYIYFSFEDRDLPDLKKLHALADLGAYFVRHGCKVLSHCGMGHNRSALLAGLILNKLGMSGAATVAQIRQHRQGALYNKKYAAYLESLPGATRFNWKFDFGKQMLRSIYTSSSNKLVPNSLKAKGMLEKSQSV